MAPPFKAGKKGKADDCYPPSRFAMEASSPYFIGKHKFPRRRVEESKKSPAKKATLLGHGFGGGELCSSTQPESSKGIIVHKDLPTRTLSGASVNACNGLAFDFSGDPKLRRIREVIVSIVDSVSLSKFYTLRCGKRVFIFPICFEHILYPISFLFLVFRSFFPSHVNFYIKIATEYF
ncbi:unnamed protein product [Strongylus vulgaris]|uniref:Uncharacterized protein n=1 Tax=Strongylus vulgaris TaxID=40348 RepID=A0A3P7IXK0_STRVU|nr:unnamed protein product [Strongylus vulgaris]